MTVVSHLRVKPDPVRPERGTLACGELMFPCVLGRTGVSGVKYEGDGATPTGSYFLRRVLYRADRIGPPQTALNVAAIARDDGWCDDPADACYNKPVRLPYPASAENMWRDDHMYDLVVVLGHNDDPVIPGKGSAIFMHVASPDGAPTAGCVALSREDLLTVLEKIESGTVIEIQAD